MRCGVRKAMTMALPGKSESYSGTPWRSGMASDLPVRPLAEKLDPLVDALGRAVARQGKRAGSARQPGY